MHSSKVYTKLQERLGLGDHLAVMNVMLAKIAANLKVYGGSEQVVEQTLQLFQVGGGGFTGGAWVVRHGVGGCLGGGGCKECVEQQPQLFQV